MGNEEKIIPTDEEIAKIEPLTAEEQAELSRLLSDEELANGSAGAEGTRRTGLQFKTAAQTYLRKIVHVNAILNDDQEDTEEEIATYNKWKDNYKYRAMLTYKKGLEYLGQ